MADSIEDLREDLDRLCDKMRLQEKQAKCEHGEIRILVTKGGNVSLNATCTWCGKKFEREIWESYAPSARKIRRLLKGYK